MAERQTPWTIEEVAARFEEAASTGRRLPPVRVQGYFNTWRWRIGRSTSIPFAIGRRHRLIPSEARNPLTGNPYQEKLSPR